MTYDFAEDGFCVVRALCDPAPIAREVESYQTLGLTGRSINWTAGSLHSIHGLYGPFFDTLLAQMAGRAGALLGEDAVPRAAELFAKPAGVGLPSPWHQDNAYWCLEPAIGLTIWIALDACDATNGGLTYLVGSHLGGLFAHQPSHAPGSSQTVADLPHLDHVTVALEPGDALVHHCLTIHGSAANTSGTARRGVTLQYEGVSARVDLAQQLAYEASLDEQIKGRA